MDYKGLNEEKVSKVSEQLEDLINDYMDANYDSYRLRGQVDTEFLNDTLNHVMEVVRGNMGLID